MKKHEMMDKIIQYHMRKISTNEVAKALDEYTSSITDVFKCRACNHELPIAFNVRTEGFCYLCDPNVTLEECLSDEPLKSRNEEFEHLKQALSLAKRKLVIAEDALNDIIKWDDDLQDLYGGQDARANCALEKIMILDGF